MVISGRSKVFIALFLTVSSVNTTLSLLSGTAPFVVVSSAATGIIGTAYLIVLCRKISSLQSLCEDKCEDKDRPNVIYYDSETDAIINEIAIIEQKKKSENVREFVERTGNR